MNAIDITNRVVAANTYPYPACRQPVKGLLATPKCLTRDLDVEKRNERRWDR